LPATVQQTFRRFAIAILQFAVFTANVANSFVFQLSSTKPLVAFVEPIGV